MHLPPHDLAQYDGPSLLGLSLPFPAGVSGHLHHNASWLPRWTKRSIELPLDVVGGFCPCIRISRRLGSVVTRLPEQIGLPRKQISETKNRGNHQAHV